LRDINAEAEAKPKYLFKYTYIQIFCKHIDYLLYYNCPYIYLNMLTKNIHKDAWKKKLVAATRICVWQLNFSC